MISSSLKRLLRIYSSFAGPVSHFDWTEFGEQVTSNRKEHRLIVFFNWIGLGFLFLAAIIALMLESQNPDSGDQFFVRTGVVLAVLDLAFRFLWLRPRMAKENERMQSHWLTSGRGGSLMFLPAWIFAAVAPAVVWLLLGI